jgi:hypothetical protein
MPIPGAYRPEVVSRGFRIEKCCLQFCPELAKAAVSVAGPRLVLDRDVVLRLDEGGFNQ